MSPVVLFRSLSGILIAVSILIPDTETHYIDPSYEDLGQLVDFQTAEFFDGDDIASVDDNSIYDDADDDVDDDDVILDALRSLQLDSEAGPGKERKCKCGGGACACCLRISLRRLRINTTCCLNVTYLQSEIGFRLSIQIGRRIIFNKEISVKNPPPICVGIPGLKILARACVELYDIGVQNKTFNCCVKLSVKTVATTIFHIKLGCLRFPLHRREDFENAMMLADAWRRDAMLRHLDLMQLL